VIGRRLELADAAALKPFFDTQPYPLAVYSLLSILAWRRADGYDVSYAVVDGSVVFAAEGAEGRHLALPVGPRAPSLRELRAVAERLGFGEYWYVPGEYLAAFPVDEVRASFEVRERPEWGEYVFLTEDLAELRGRRLAAKRNLIHQFEKAYVEIGRASAGPILAEDVEDCAAFLEAWCEERGCEDADRQPLACERRAAETALREMHELGAEGVSVRADGKIVGFGIGYRVTDGLGALHFEKAFASIKGLYQYLDRECARRMFQGRFERVSKESDMGLPGLAQSKQSYGPLSKTAAFALSLR
jgi:uncharacterized protein